MARESVKDRLKRVVESPNNRCFACGPSNPHGLHLRFAREGGVVRTEFTPGEWHEGWEGVIHGGILGALLDEAMAYTIFFDNVQAVTARMETRYRRPAYSGEALTVEAWITRDARRLIDTEARILRGDQVIAEASARFMKQGTLESTLAKV